MKAAVVSSFDAAPRYADVPEPVATGDHELIVDVIAAGPHPRVRSQADGSHYTSTDELPLIPGIDGVGRSADGLLRYFLLPETTRGAMAQRTAVDARRSVVLPEGSDPIAVAAAMNPAMSSWVALRQRIAFEPGQKVLVLGATGSSGQLAVQVARLLGADQIIAAGRDSGRLRSLPALGATDTVQLGLDSATDARRLGEAATEVDVVLDYLWGQPTAAAMTAVITGRTERRNPITWIEIGSVAGPTAEIPSAALRAARLQIVGSGQGSVATHEIVAELAAIAEAITAGSLYVDAVSVPLFEVEAVWGSSAGSSRRIVLTP